MNESEHTKEPEFDLFRLLGVLRKKGWLLFLSAVLGASLALAGTFFLVSPRYQSTVTLYVSQTKSGKNLADSFSVIVKMRESLMDVVKYTQTNRSYNELRNMIEVASVTETDFIEITVTSSDPFEAEAIADAIGAILPEQVARIMEGTAAKVVGEAIPAADPSSPSYPNSALLGFLIGFLLALGILFLQEIFAPKEKIRP